MGTILVECKRLLELSERESSFLKDKILQLETLLRSQDYAYNQLESCLLERNNEIARLNEVSLSFTGTQWTRNRN